MVGTDTQKIEGLKPKEARKPIDMRTMVRGLELIHNLAENAMRTSPATAYLEMHRIYRIAAELLADVTGERKD